jgi:DNA-directed RNA polymerase specialized sigma24 family protein
MGSPIPPGAAGDRELWLRASDGDTAAFGELFGRHANAVYNHLFRRVADWSEAEDLTSAVFLQAWRTRGRVLRNHRRASRRYRAALRRIVPADEAAGDHADAVAAAVDSSGGQRHPPGPGGGHRLPEARRHRVPADGHLLRRGAARRAHRAGRRGLGDHHRQRPGHGRGDREAVVPRLPSSNEAITQRRRAHARLQLPIR